ncbi:MAG: glycogen debranching enzyme N-terminal domain-containing protein, partial [Anaerolineales bacterium]|nr:glycogen debranching enzyme N-terminal domain-containing protein [Anaerolineales bacterium]
MVQFWRNICNNFDTASSREWLVTNGIGGYASGTIAGVLTRRYHGLLIAALKPPLERTLLVSKYDASVLYDGEEYPLFTNHWGASAIPPKSGGPRGAIEPQGYLHIESFRLEGTTPVWTFANANALLEKRIWMEYGKNTTYVRYNFVQGSSPLELRIKAIVNYRDHHASTRAGDWEMQVNPVENGLRFSAHKDATPYYLLSSGATASAQHQWYQNYYLSIEAFRGLEELEDNLYSGEFQAELMPGNSITLVASTEPTPNLDGNSAFIERQTYEQNLLAIATPFWQQTSHT